MRLPLRLSEPQQGRKAEPGAGGVRYRWGPGAVHAADCRPQRSPVDLSSHKMLLSKVPDVSTDFHFWKSVCFQRGKKRLSLSWAL